jgi:hypothetical protein
VNEKIPCQKDFDKLGPNDGLLLTDARSSNLQGFRRLRVIVSEVE